MERVSGERPKDHTVKDVVSTVPKGILVSGLIAACFILVVIAGWLLTRILSPMSPAITGIAFAILLTGLLLPLKKRINRLIRNSHAAAGLTMFIFIGGLIGTLVVTGTQLVTGFEELSDSVFAALAQLETWLREGPIGNDAGFSEYLQRAQDWVSNNSGQLLGGAVAAGSAVGTFSVSMVLALVTTFFFLADGRRIWLWFVRLLPSELEDRLDLAFSNGFYSVRAYVRTQAIVAAVDAVGIGLGAFALGLPLVIPLTIIVFLTSFIPVVGAFAAGALVVLIAWFSQGLTAALIMLGIVVLVQQLEGNLLQPVLMSRAVDLHPWGVIIGVALGSYIYGIVGALFAVPIMALLKVVVLTLRREMPQVDLSLEESRTDWPQVLANARTLGQRAVPAWAQARRGGTGSVAPAAPTQGVSGSDEDPISRATTPVSGAEDPGAAVDEDPIDRGTTPVSGVADPGAAVDEDLEPDER